LRRTSQRISSESRVGERYVNRFGANGGDPSVSAWNVIDVSLSAVEKNAAGAPDASFVLPATPADATLANFASTAHVARCQ
jgi:hypothetical protein